MEKKLLLQNGFGYIYEFVLGHELRKWKKRGESSKIEFTKLKTRDTLYATCVFQIAMNFGSTYVGSLNKGLQKCRKYMRGCGN